MRKEDLLEFLGVHDGNFFNYRGYDLLVLDYQQSYVTCPMITFRLNGKITEENKKLIKANLKGVGGYNADNKKGFMFHILCNSLMGKRNEEKLLKFKEAFDAFISVLENNGLKTLSTCVICKKVDNEPLEDHIIDDKLVLTHSHCFEEYKNGVLKEIEKNEGNKKAYPLSIIFAILGASLGYLAFFLIALLTNVMFGILFLAIPYLAYQGYKLGKAPLNKTSTIIISVVSLIVILVGIADTFGLFIYPIEEVLEVALGDILFCLIFGLAGIGYSIKTISKDNNENRAKKLK